MASSDELPLWAEVDLGRISRNVARLKDGLQPGTRLLVVVKAGGYGHGDVPAAQAAVRGGADWLGVARVREGDALRKAGISQPILLLAEPPPAAVEDAISLELTPTVYSEHTAQMFSRKAAAGGAGKLAVHLKVDTGMHRYGAAPEKVVAFWDYVTSLPGLEVTGIWSHFAVAEDVLNSFTKHQYEIFADVLEALGSRVDGVTRHLANSAGAITFPDAHLDMVRCGIVAYGIHPSEELGSLIELEPAMSFKSRIGMVKRLPAGEPISYGQRYAMPSAGFVATVPCGYADGLRRAMSNNGDVLVRGKRYPICGTITMDHFLIDLGEDQAEPGDEVVILGAQGDDYIGAHEIARRLSTIPYEVVCGISARVPRIYIS